MKKIFLLILLSQVVACAPVIYTIDRQTVMEADASGDWPDVEKKLLKAGLKEGTTFFAKVRPKKGAEENENILNGELSGK